MFYQERVLGVCDPEIEAGSFNAASRSKLIGLHFGPKKDNSHHDQTLNQNYRGIIHNIQDGGEEVVITRGKEHFDALEGTVDEFWIPILARDGLMTVVNAKQHSLEKFGVVRDYGGEMDLLGKVVQINTPTVREITDVKSNANQHLFSEFQPKTVSFAQEFHPDMLDTIPGDRVVVKPDRSSGARNVHITTKEGAESVIACLPDDVKERGIVIQEFIDMHRPFPADITGIDIEEQAKLNSSASQKKELRVFQFFGRNGNKKAYAFLPQARVGLPGSDLLIDDYKVAVDPDYLPDEVLRISEIAVGRVIAATGVPEVFGAIDFSYGMDAAGELAWRPMEFNSWKPAFDRGNKDVSRRYDNLVAEQLIRAARN